ncbi:hypothetical protein BJP40_13480 [Streptomyces sp. CC53]|uniref:hypothetical protein n=1 Tax=unclassified Streptomyces TaxID=2593676 RepID=UPI0008DDC3F2|nr:MULTISPECIES: hypothetical protein [unclassified Streptomyces]OII59531.1 hypothetical protein BJP40_13480 [Streptomyces sp. CC53]
MPEPGGEKYDVHRARLRKEGENQGVSDQDANEEANAKLQESPEWSSRGPRTERGRGPKGERGRGRAERGEQPE